MTDYRFNLAARAFRQLTPEQLAGLLEAKKVAADRDKIEAELRKKQQDVWRLEAELAALDRKIKGLIAKNAPPAGQGKGGRRGGGPAGQTISETIVAALRKSAKPMRLTDLAKTILTAGFKTRSAFPDFRTNVAHALQRLQKRVKRETDGWVLGEPDKK